MAMHCKGGWQARARAGGFARDALLVAPFTVVELSAEDRHAQDPKRHEEQHRENEDARDARNGRDERLHHDFELGHAAHEAQRAQHAEEAEHFGPADVHQGARGLIEEAEGGDGAVDPVPPIGEVGLA